MKPFRVYIDTSVVGGCFDDEFQKLSRRFFEQVRVADIRLLVSDLLIEELEGAPEDVRGLLASLPAEGIEDVFRDAESLALRDAYTQASVVGPTAMNDAFHVAIATVARADVIVSWNFRHFVNLEKIRGFNAANLRMRYGMIDIRSPQEVIRHEEEKDV